MTSHLALILKFSRDINNTGKWNGVHNIMNFLKTEVESPERILSIHDLNADKLF